MTIDWIKNNVKKLQIWILVKITLTRLYICKFISLIFKKCSRKLKFRFDRNVLESIGLYNNDVFLNSYASINLLYSTYLKLT